MPEVEVFNERMRNLDEIERDSIKSLDENGIAVNGRFLQRQEDFIRQL
jgi:hypothetical protein